MAVVPSAAEKSSPRMVSGIMTAGVRCPPTAEMVRVPELDGVPAAATTEAAEELGVEETLIEAGLKVAETPGGAALSCGTTEKEPVPWVRTVVTVAAP